MTSLWNYEDKFNLLNIMNNLPQNKIKWDTGGFMGSLKMTSVDSLLQLDVPVEYHQILWIS